MSKVSITIDEIKGIYKLPKWGLISPKLFIKRMKENNLEFDEVEALKALSNDDINQVFRKPKQYPPYEITAPPRSFQMDIMFMPNFSKQNGGIENLLVIIDILSRKAFVYPMKTKTMREIMENVEKFESKVVGGINNLSGDDEFNKKELLDWAEAKKIRTRFDVAKNEHNTAGNKLGIIDNFIRRLRKIILKYMYLNDTTKYIDILQEILDNYNMTPLKSLDWRSPDFVYQDFVAKNQMREKQIRHNLKLLMEQMKKINIGDMVRIRTKKEKFQKEGALFSMELYKVEKLDGFRYIVSRNGQELKTRFKANELMKVEEATSGAVASAKLKQQEPKQQEKHSKVTEVVEQNRKDKRVVRRLKKEGLM